MIHISQTASQLEIRASTANFSRYKELVDSDWNKSTLEAVLDLLWDVIHDSASEQLGDSTGWWQFLQEVAEHKRSKAMPEEIVERLRLLSFILREPFVPEMPNKLVLGKSKLALQTQATIVYLLLQALTPLRGESGFFRDLQSLLYMNAVHYLLPHLEKNAMHTEQASLVNVMHMHAILAWRGDPSHMFYLLSALMGQLGHQEARLYFLDRSVASTPIHDHSYLTKANAYWAELLEAGEKDKAMEFLLQLNRNAPEPYIEEIGDMIRETAAS